MYSERYIPSLKYAPIIKSRGTVWVETKDIAYLDISVFDIQPNSSKVKPIYTAYLVRPLNILVLDCESDELSSVIETQKYQKVDLYEVDYEFIASRFILEDIQNNEGLFTILYPVSGGSVTSYDVVDTGYIFSSINGEFIRKDDPMIYPVNPNTIESVEGEDYGDKAFITPKIMEALGFDDLMPSKVSIKALTNDDPITVRLEPYFKEGYTMNRTPLLVGGTAVAKSALVKELAHKNNMRLVDVRTAFISRLDIEGLTERLDIDGTVVSYNAPMSDMLECSDEYVDYCRRMVPILENYIETTDDTSKIAPVQKALVKFREGAKTPVLFFDEITRCEQSVRQVLTKILSDKAFMGNSLAKARVIAATNSSVEGDELYQVNQVEDVAFLDRFESIVVSPADVMDRWRSWASMDKTANNKNIHPLIMDYIGDNDTRAYDMRPLTEIYDQTGDLMEVSSTSYPNFRTWELVSDYLYAQTDKTYSPESITGLIGTQHGADFISHLNGNGWKEKNDTRDYFTRIVDEGMDTGVPTMLIGPSALGKTSRVKKAVKDRGAEFLEINLAEQDRTDICGTPVKVDIKNHIMEGIDVQLPPEIEGIMKDELDKTNLPKRVTVKAPKLTIKQKFQQAYALGKDVVLFFDEVNRVQNPSVMSALFEAISDHRIFGVNFDPSRVKIFSACNLGDNTEDAMALDPALSARFSIHRKRAYDESDAQSFLDYAKSQDFDPLLTKYLEDMGNSKLLETLKSVETRTLTSSASSSRGIEDLNKYLKNSKNKLMTGTVLFPEIKDIQRISNISNKSKTDKNIYAELSSILNEIDSKLDNWSGLDSSNLVKIGSVEVTPENLKDLCREAKAKLESPDLDPNDPDDYNKTFTVLEALIKVDAGVKRTRGKVFEYALGDNSENFTKYYNNNSGKALVKVDLRDIRNKSLIAQYVKQEMLKVQRQDQHSYAGVEIMENVYKEFKDSLSLDHYKTLINSIYAYLASTDAKSQFLTNCSSKESTVDKILFKVGNEDRAYTFKLLEEIGVNIDKKLVDEYDRALGGVK